MSTPQVPGACCVSGHLHEGTPKGHVVELGGLPTYATGNPKSKRIIVYVVDIFGCAPRLIHLRAYSQELTRGQNARLLADEYAAAGFYVLIPDILQGDPVDPKLLLKIAPVLSGPERSEEQAKKDGADVGATLGPWIGKHSEEVVGPLVKGFVADLKAGKFGQEHTTAKIGAVGFCFGGKYALQLGNGAVDAVAACHPSFVNVETDVKTITVPTSIAIGDHDGMFPDKEQDKVREIFSAASYDSEYKTYEGQVHGFAVRGDLSKGKELEGKESACKQVIQFFSKHL